jgi:drug/metabolite transporter (DMT)-like permease
MSQHPSPPSAAAPITQPQARAWGVLAAVVTVLIWTGFIVIARASADPTRGGVLGPFDIIFARIVGASLIVLPWGWWLVRRARQTEPHAGSLWGLSPMPLRQTVITGLLGGVVYGMLAYSGFVFAPAAHASVLMPGSLPLWTTLVALLLLGERISPARVLGLALIVGGDLLVGGHSLLHAFDGSGVWRGDVLFIASSIVWACYSVLVRHYALQAVQATVGVTVFAFFAYVPAYVLLVALGWVPSNLLSASWHDIGYQMLTQGVGSVVVSGITFNLMIRYYGPVRSTMITAVVPGLSALAAAALLAEPLPWNVLLGLTLVTAGIVFGVSQVATKIKTA